MPELPEVETIKNYLIQEIKFKTVKQVLILDKRIPALSLLNLTLLKGQTIRDISRKGKYLLFIFDDYILISHLRMEGKYYIYKNSEQDSKYARIIFELSDNTKLIYDDMRRFGTMQLFSKKGFDVLNALPNVGKEPWEFSYSEFHERIKLQKKEIKSVLLDQSLIAGIGNIYADEILYDVNISPFKKACNLNQEETKSILDSACKILNLAIKEGGSTIKSYHPSRDISGNFQNSLKAYNQEKKQCSKCNHLMIKNFLHGRSTTYCPNCQNVAKVVAIYGKIASGKTTILNMFKKHNYPCFSADEEVAKLYKNDLSFTLKCVKIFGEECLNAFGKVSKEYIKQVVIRNDEKKKALEGIIHPIIQKKAVNFIKENINSEIIILEIPLLFEAKMNNIVDYIIGVEVSDFIQKQHLKNRNSISLQNDLVLNSNHKFEKNIKQCDFIINNNGTIKDLQKDFDDLLKQIINL